MRCYVWLAFTTYWIGDNAHFRVSVSSVFNNVGIR